MKKSQIAALVGLAALDLAVLCGLGFAVYNTTTRIPAPQQVTAPPAPTPSPTPPPTPTEEVYTPVFEPGECPFDPPAGATVECGYVIAPEDRAGDLSDVIRLAVAVYHSASDNPAPDPVIYLAGGPGGQDVARSDYYYDKLAQISNRDIVFFDQRGVGLSEPMLDCPEVKTLYLQDQMHAIPTGEREPRYTETLLACRDRLVSEGANLAAYTSAASAADVNDIAAALGYEQVNLYGISYGTRLALTVMRDFPTLVRSAVLDSVLPVEARPYLEGCDNGQQALNTLFEECAADQECNAAYPDLETVFYDLVEQLNSEPITVEVSLAEEQPYTATVDGVEFRNAVVWGLHVSSLIPIAPQAIYDVHDGDYNMLSYALALPAWTYEDISLGMMTSVDCHEQIFTITPEEIDASLTPSHQTASVGLNDVYSSGQELFSICEQWGAAPFDPFDDQPVVSDIPTLLISGEYDPTTPPGYAQQAAANLSHSYSFEIPGQGHAPSVGEASECILSVAAAFLNTPIADPYRVCIAGLEEPQFVVPFDSAGKEEITFEPFVSQEYGVEGIVPSGWKDVGLGFYNRHAYPLDIVQIGMQTSLVGKDEWLDWLSTQFQRAGLSSAPQFAGEREANGFTWTLYTATYKKNPVDLALADAGGATMLVILLSNNDEHAALYEQVFVPVVDALLPLD